MRWQPGSLRTAVRNFATNIDEKALPNLVERICAGLIQEEGQVSAKGERWKVERSLRGHDG